MWLVSIVVVAIFLWLVFNLPFKEKQVEDTYERFLQEVENRKEKE